ncbi:MAG: hypothetical protein ACOYVK_17050 [Bacillota bacterium]
MYRRKCKQRSHGTVRGFPVGARIARPLFQEGKRWNCPRGEADGS